MFFSFVKQLKKGNTYLYKQLGLQSLSSSLKLKQLLIQLFTSSSFSQLIHVKGNTLSMITNPVFWFVNSHVKVDSIR